VIAYNSSLNDWGANAIALMSNSAVINNTINVTYLGTNGSITAFYGSGFVNMTNNRIYVYSLVNESVYRMAAQSGGNSIFTGNIIQGGGVSLTGNNNIAINNSISSSNSGIVLAARNNTLGNISLSNITGEGCIQFSGGLIENISLSGCGSTYNILINVVNTTFRNSHISGSGIYNIVVAPTSNNTLIQNVTFENSATPVIYAVPDDSINAYRAGNLTIEGCTFINGSNYAISGTNVDGFHVKDNNFSAIGHRSGIVMGASDSTYMLNGNDHTLYYYSAGIGVAGLYTPRTALLLADGIHNIDVWLVNGGMYILAFVNGSLATNCADVEAGTGLGGVVCDAYINDAFVAQGPGVAYDNSNLLAAFNSTFNISVGKTYPPYIGPLKSVLPLIYAPNSPLDFTGANTISENTTIVLPVSTSNVIEENIVGDVGSVYSLKTNVTGIEVNNSHAKITWANSSLSVSNTFVDNVVLGDKFVSVNSNVVSSLNQPANVTLTGVNCSSYDLYYSPSFGSTRSAIQAGGSSVANQSTPNDGDCSLNTVCKHVVCAGSTLTFEAQHFSGYAIGITGDQLAIMDSKENSFALINTNIDFYANYSTFAGVPITGASCNLTLDGWVGSTPMTYNILNNLYEASGQYATAGNQTWMVRCGKTGSDTIIASDWVIVYASVPEWSDIVYGFLLAGLIGLFIWNRKRN